MLIEIRVMPGAVSCFCLQQVVCSHVTPKKVKTTMDEMEKCSEVCGPFKRHVYVEMMYKQHVSHISLDS